MKKDYYASLGISSKASAEEIKAAYKNLAKKHHPDLNKGNKQSEEKFKEINEAYRILGDEKKRAQYDKYGADEQAQSQGSAGGAGFEGFDGFDININDIFGEFFGGSDFFGRSGSRNKGEDIQIEVELTLEEAAKGKRHKVKVDRLRPCVSCKGSGAEGGQRRACPDCKGQGRLRKSQRTPFGVFQTVVVCETCSGMRSIPEKMCPKCRGHGRIDREEELSVDIPAGIGDRMQLRVPGEGNAGLPGQAPGDLLVAVYVQEHELFARDGDDLHIVSTITYAQAVLGTNIDVPTLFGSVKLSIPAGTESHTVFRTKGKGMPNLRSGTGDLLVTVKIAVPKSLTKEERTIIEKLAGIEKPKSFFERLKF